MWLTRQRLAARERQPCASCGRLPPALDPFMELAKMGRLGHFLKMYA
jgi:hypothetical protein